MGGVRNIMVRAGADFSQLSQAMRQAQGEASVFGSNMEGIFTRIGLVGNGIKTVFEGILHSIEGMSEFAKEASELDGRLSSLNARLGDSAQAFQNWADSNGQALGISKKDMIEQGASISAMLETSISDKQKLAGETEQMLKNIAIVSSATGKSQQEVSERMVSALQGHSAAVSALDLNMHLSSLRMSQSYKEIAGNSPWAKLTAEQQQMIIVSNLNEQVQQKFGSTVVEDAATRMNRFTAALSNVKTSLEQAFTPILYAVLPYLTAFINSINTALQYVTAFFQALFGYHGAVLKAVTGDINDQTDAVNGLAGAYGNLNDKIGGTGINKKGSKGSSIPKVKTDGIGGPGTNVGGGKKLGTGFTASFDQVHTIPEVENPNSSNANNAANPGGGAIDLGAGLEQGSNKGASALDDLRNKFQGFADSVKTYLHDILAEFKKVWDPISDYFKIVTNGLKKWWDDWGRSVVQALVNAWNFMKPILVFIFEFIWESIKGAIDGCIQFFEGLTEFLTGVFTGDWNKIFQGLWDMIVGGLMAVWNIFNLIFIADGIGAVKGFAEKGLKYILDFFFHSGKGAQDFVGNIGRWFVEGFKGIKNIINDVDLFFYRVFDGMLHKSVDLWNGMIDGAQQAWQGIQNIFYDAVGWFTRMMVTPIINAFNKIVNGFSTNGITGGLKQIWNVIADDINNVISLINGIMSNIPGGFQINWQAPHFFAKGGIVTGATNAIVGEAGTEVIQPLSALQGMVANTVAQTINTVMAMQGGSRNQGTQPIVLNVDGKTFARIMKPYLDNETLRVGPNVRLNTI